MVAQIEGFRTRGQLGLRNPRSISRNIQPSRGGCVLHWGGPRQNNTTHAQCEQTWRQWQDYHMRPGGLGTRNGAADIAYTAGFCQHGYVLAGRGIGVRTGANGTNEANTYYYAFVWIGGAGQTPSRKALDAADWLIWDARRKGAGRRVRRHTDFRSTTCPGSDVGTHARSRDNANITQPTAPVKRDFWEVFMAEELTEEEARIAKEMFAFLANHDEGVERGHSWPMQTLRLHRMLTTLDIKGKHFEFLAGLVKGVEEMRHARDTISNYFNTGRSFARASIALWREAGARQWLRDWNKFSENKDYTEGDLN